MTTFLIAAGNCRVCDLMTARKGTVLAATAVDTHGKGQCLTKFVISTRWLGMRCRSTSGPAIRPALWSANKRQRTTTQSKLQKRRAAKGTAVGQRKEQLLRALTDHHVVHTADSVGIVSAETD